MNYFLCVLALSLYCVSNGVHAMHDQKQVATMAEAISMLGDEALQAGPPCRMQYVSSAQLAFTCAYVAKTPTVDFGMMVVRTCTKCHGSVTEPLQSSLTGGESVFPYEKDALVQDENSVRAWCEKITSGESLYFGVPLGTTTLIVLIEVDGNEDSNDTDIGARCYQAYKHHAYDLARQACVQHCDLYFVEADRATIKKVVGLLHKVHTLDVTLEPEQIRWLNQYRGLPETLTGTKVFEHRSAFDDMPIETRLFLGFGLFGCQIL